MFGLDKLCQIIKKSQQKNGCQLLTTFRPMTARFASPFTFGQSQIILLRAHLNCSDGSLGIQGILAETSRVFSRPRKPVRSVARIVADQSPPPTKIFSQRICANHKNGLDCHRNRGIPRIRGNLTGLSIKYPLSYSPDTKKTANKTTLPKTSKAPCDLDL